MQQLAGSRVKTLKLGVAPWIRGVYVTCLIVPWLPKPRVSLLQSVCLLFPLSRVCVRSARHHGVEFSALSLVPQLQYRLEITRYLLSAGPYGLSGLSQPMGHGVLTYQECVNRPREGPRTATFGREA
mgnify:CR=1 FL=1